MAALMLPIPDLPADDPRGAEVAVARALAFARAGRHQEAARTYRDAIASAAYDDAGWLLPVEPILQAQLRPEIWGEVLGVDTRARVFLNVFQLCSGFYSALSRVRPPPSLTKRQ
jgi:hypothetical protein